MQYPRRVPMSTARGARHAARAQAALPRRASRLG
jgi:hypothetical protein